MAASMQCDVTTKEEKSKKNARHKNQAKKLGAEEDERLARGEET